MKEREPTVVEQTIRIEASAETVYRHFTDADRLAAWWGLSEVDPRPGGRLSVAMADGPKPIMRGEFVELVPFERIVFTFGWESTPGAPNIPPGSSRVEVTLVERDGGTMLTLRHSGLPTTLGDETRQGWGDYLGRLAAAAAD